MLIAEIKGVGQFQAFAGKFPEQVDKALSYLASWAADRARTYVVVRTGFLMRSIGWGRIGPMHYFAGAQASYAKHVERGRGPVYPKKPGGVLVFRPSIKQEFVVTPRGKQRPRAVAKLRYPGDLVFARHVGPAKAQPFLKPAMKDMVARALEVLKAYIQEAV